MDTSLEPDKKQFKLDLKPFLVIATANLKETPSCGHLLDQTKIISNWISSVFWLAPGLALTNLKKRLLVDASLGAYKKHLKLDLKHFLVGTLYRHRKSKRNAFLWTPPGTDKKHFKLDLKRFC